MTRDPQGDKIAADMLKNGTSVEYAKDEEEQVEEARKMAMFIRGSFKWRVATLYMKFIMVIEGFLWSFMDMARSHRMKIAARINSNYHRSQ